MKTIVLFLTFGVLGFNAFANQSGSLFNIIASGTPSQVDITLCLNAKGPLSCEAHRVNALNLTLSTVAPNHRYAGAGIKINTPGYSIANSNVVCSAIVNDYCVFTVSDADSVAITIAGATSVDINYWAYIVGQDTSNIIYKCDINTTSGALSCVNSGWVQNQTQGQPINTITLNKARTMAYLSDNNFSRILKCAVDSSGLLTDCTTLNGPTTYVSYPDAIVLNRDETAVYITNLRRFNNSGYFITECSRDTATGDLTDCANQLFSVDNSPNSAVLNPSGTLLYIAYSNNSQGGVAYCPVSNTSNTFSNCNDANVLGFTSTNGITLNSAGNVLYIIGSNDNVTDSSSVIQQCNVNITDGSLSACSPSNQGVFSDARSLALNGTLAYVVNYDPVDANVYTCAVSASTGALGSCTVVTPTPWIDWY